MSDLNNFARIEFTRMECFAIRELRDFINQLSRETAAQKQTLEMSRVRLALKRVAERMGAVRSEGFTPVDVTQDECVAVDTAGEFFNELCRANQIDGAARAGLQQMQVNLASARMKCSAAALIIKPNVATDVRLS